MKVITKQASSTVSFKDVGPGQVFVYSDGEVYMALDSTYHCHNEDGHLWAEWTAVHLATGALTEFDTYHEVTIPQKIIPLEIAY